MTVRNSQLQKDQFYNTQFQNKKIANKTMAEVNAIKSLDNDINNFQKKLSKKVDSSDEEDDIKDMPLQKSNSRLSSEKFRRKDSILNRIGGLLVNSIEETNSPGKVKKSLQVDEKSKHQREKRRRKMIVQQNKRYQMIEITRR